MNHLKHIRGISVRASSNATLPSHYGQHVDVFENRQLKSQLLRSNPLSIAKKSHGVDAKYLGQFRQNSLRLISKDSKTTFKQCSKTKSSVTSLKKKSWMHKKLPSESIAKRVCHYSTCQNVKFNGNRINEQLMPQSMTMNGAKNRNCHSSFIASVEKHPQSYAEMIADYSESLYREFTVGAQNDSFYFNNAICKSPFSTFSVPPPAEKIVNDEYSKLSTEKNDFPLPIKSFDLCNQYDSINTNEYYDFKYHNTCAAKAMNKNINRSCVITNNLESDDQSYAKLIANCSKSMHNIPVTMALNDGLVPKRNMLAKNSFESVITPARKISDTQETSQKVTPTVSMPFEKNIKEKAIDLEENNWLRETKNGMRYLKSMTKRKVATVVDVPKMKKKGNILQSMDAFGNSLDRIHGLTEPIESNDQKKKGMSIRRLNYQSEKIGKMEKRKKVLELQKHNYSHSSDKISNLPQHFGNTAQSSTIRKNSTNVSITNGNIEGVLKQPQVKLHMVPSEKESVVSINVAQTSFGSLASPNSASKHLSVVVQSNQKEDLQLIDNQWNASTLRRTTKSALQRSDFGPMRISISENSAPVKQIEFSINGKPVSELKSITARTERLDVVSSVDKIEIRIPFAKDDLNTLDKTREGDLSKEVNSNIGQVLNVQISANFQDDPTKDSIKKPAKTIQYQYDKDIISKSPISKTPSLSNNFPKAREETLSNNNIQQYESSKRMDIKFDDTETNINKYKTPGDVNFKMQRKTTRDLSADKMITGISLIKKINNVDVGSLNMKKVNITGFSEVNKHNENESSDNRVPSKIIPWWSSSDSFNKIKKKENDYKSLKPSLNRNEQKAVSSLNQDLFAESSLSKSKETSDSKILTKKAQSVSNTTVTTSDFSNIISYSNSTKPYEESRHYAHPFRFNLNQGDSGIIPKITKNGLKAEDNQTLTGKKNINEISGIKQTESITLFRSDTMNIKNKYDINVKGKTSALQEKIKAPSSAQNLSKRNHEKKSNSLKQTSSIDNVSNNIVYKIKDILDAIKPIEKGEDSALVDHNLKREIPSRNPTTKLNNRVKEVQNLSPVITTKDFIPNTSTVKIVSKKIDETMLTKQTESTNTEELKTKMDTSLKKKNFTIKNDATIKEPNKNNVANIKEVRKNDFMSLSSSNLKNSSELMQTLKKQEQLVNDSIIFQDKLKQDLKSLLEANKNGHSSLNTRTSSGTMQKSKKLGISGKISEISPSEESKQNGPKSLTSIENTPETIQEFGELKNLTSSKSANPSKESSDTLMIDKSPLQTIKQTQSKSSKNINTNEIANVNNLSSSQVISVSKVKDHAVSKNLMDKDAGKMSQMRTKRTEVRDMLAKIVTQNPKSKNPLLKDCEENCFNKSESGKRRLFGSAGSSRKPNDSVGFKSVGFQRGKTDIISNSQSAIFKVRQNLNDVDMLECPVSTVIESDRGNGSWINMDRPEKSILYSAWLQRSENDIKKDRK